MTVLKGELAVQQSIALVRAFKAMRITEQESKSFNSQYGPLDIMFTDEFHDRTLSRRSLYQRCRQEGI